MTDTNELKVDIELAAPVHKQLLQICDQRNLSIGELIEDLVKRTGASEAAANGHSRGPHYQSRNQSKFLWRRVTVKTETKPDSKQGNFQPQTHLREAAIDPERSALLFIDLQNFNCHREGAYHRDNPDDPKLDYWWQRNQDARKGWQQLQRACRKGGIEVMFTVMQSLTEDGRDRSLDYKISGFHIPPNSFDSQVLDCIQPEHDEIVIPKTSSSVFNTTNVDTILRNLDVKNLILVGALTDQCVESAVRDACDLNYLVTLVTDGCVTYSQERHDNSLTAIKGYCRQRTAEELIAEIQGLQK